MEESNNRKQKVDQLSHNSEDIQPVAAQNNNMICSIQWEQTNCEAHNCQISGVTSDSSGKLPYTLNENKYDFQTSKCLHHISKNLIIISVLVVWFFTY